ncbi:MAG: NAD(+)/NADH kinase [Muribaculaceae bacterium]|nr:NAD(+)/NADH kinase [Muribaculaceae bacterium]
MRIAIYGSRRQQEAAPTVARFLETLHSKGVETVMHRKLYRHLLEVIPESLTHVGTVTETPRFTADMAVSLGGDGTFLRTAMWVADKQIPIVGVNTGHLGYLTSLTIGQLPSLLDMVASDRFRIERRSLIHLDAPFLGEHFYPYALNEFALTREDTASMISARVSVDGVDLGDYRADGLLVCTSTGSTAYNLSVGGPIVQPTVDVHVIAPVAAHSLAMRPLVVDGAAEIAIVPSGRANRVRLALDGRSADVDMGTRICLSKAPFKVLVMQLADHTFADALREKLHWGIS